MGVIIRLLTICALFAPCFAVAEETVKSGNSPEADEREMAKIDGQMNSELVNALGKIKVTLDRAEDLASSVSRLGAAGAIQVTDQGWNVVKKDVSRGSGARLAYEYNTRSVYALVKKEDSQEICKVTVTGANAFFETNFNVFSMGRLLNLGNRRFLPQELEDSPYWAVRYDLRREGERLDENSYVLKYGPIVKSFIQCEKSGS